jgi:RNA polymerase sigma-70 factor (ECF subfamily)
MAINMERMQRAEFSELVTRFSYSLKPFALSLTRDMDDAKDLLQETVYRAISHQESFTEGTNLKAWLYTIMRNIYNNSYRRKQKRDALIEVAPEGVGVADEVWNYGESSLNVHEINREIEKLDDDYRTPFLMHYQGFKYQEIAGHLTIPIGTVKSRIHSARKELMKKLRRN